MPEFVVQGRSADAETMAQGVASLGGRVTRSLQNLERVSGAAVLLVETPDGVTDKELKALPGVKIVEGQYYHPFYLLPPLVSPRDMLALGLQLLPPQIFKALHPDTLGNILDTKIQEAGALEEFDVRRTPFGVPGLSLGPEVGRDTFEQRGDLAHMLELVRAPQAQAMNQGQGAIIGIVDSGVDRGIIPEQQLLSTWSDDDGDAQTVDNNGHGGMVAGIAATGAPRANFIVAKPATNERGAMRSLSTLSALDYLAGKALELRTPIIANLSWGIYGTKNLVLPCLPSDTLISTPRGSVPISELQPGDEVWSLDGEGLSRRVTAYGPGSRGAMRHWRHWELDFSPHPRKVVAMASRGIKPVWELRTTRRCVKATEEHPFLRLTRKSWGQYFLEWVPLNALRRNDIILSLKKLPDEGVEIPTPENPWGHREVTLPLAKVLGYLIGDGCLTSEHNTVLCEPLGERRTEYKEAFISLFGQRARPQYGKQPRIIPYYGEDATHVVVHSGPLSQFLADLLGGRYKTLDKVIPPWVFAAPASHRKAFLEGYFDADGHRRARGGGAVQVDSPNKPLVRGIRALAISCGYHVDNVSTLERTYQWPGRDPTVGLSHRFSVYTHEHNRHRIRGTATTRKGADTLPGVTNHPFIGLERVVSIKETVAQPVWDLQIEGSGVLFSEGLVTHNCDVFITRTVRLLDEKHLVMTSWALGNNREVAGPNTISGYCMSSSKWATSAGAVGRDLRPQPYSSLGGQCSPGHPVVAAPTFGVLPWGSGYRDFGELGGGTSSAAPQVSAALAMMMTQYPGKPFSHYRAALRASANNVILGQPGPYNPLTGAGLIQMDRAIQRMPGIQTNPWWAFELAIPSSIPVLGGEDISGAKVLKG